MKLRILDNSIRLRLSRADVERVRSSGLAKGVTRFPDGARFQYSFVSNPAAVAATAEFDDGHLQVQFPERLVHRWAETDDVSLEGLQVLDEGQALQILVEKDFACLSPREGENADELFPHPEAADRDC